MTGKTFGEFFAEWKAFERKKTMGQLLNFDARKVAPQVGIEPVPEGWYKCVVTKSNNKAANSGNGGLLELILTIIEGQFQNRVLYWNLNLYNTSAQAVEIAYKQLSALCHVIGQYQVEDTTTPDSMVPALHNIPFMAHAIVAQGNQGAINNIKAVKDLAGNDPGKQGAQGGAPQPQPGQQQAPPNPGGAWQPQGGQPQGGQPQQQWQPQGGQPQGGAPQGGPSWQTTPHPQGGQPQGSGAPAAWSPPASGPGGTQAAPWQR